MNFKTQSFQRNSVRIDDESFSVKLQFVPVFKNFLEVTTFRKLDDSLSVFLLVNVGERHVAELTEEVFEFRPRSF